MWRWPVRVLEFLLGYSEMAVLWACIALWESHYHMQLQAQTQWSLYAGAFIVISFWNWHKATMRAEAAEVAAATAEPEAPPRVFAEDSEALIAHLSDPKRLTQMQVIAYLDKWIVISGTVEFAPACDGRHVALILDRGQRVNLHLADSEENRSRKAIPGDRLTAVCQIRPAYSHARVALENGEVVRVVAPYRARLLRVS
jgi:hypothetical protein